MDMHLQGCIKLLALRAPKLKPITRLAGDKQCQQRNANSASLAIRQMQHILSSPNTTTPIVM